MLSRRRFLAGIVAAAVAGPALARLPRSGCPVLPGARYVVGQRGPEMFVPSVRGSVL